MNLKTTLPAPSKPNHIPIASQWLSGEGAGSWFCIEHQNNQFIITRYSPKGDEECSGPFVPDEPGFNIRVNYQFVHLSHCKIVCIKQNNKTYVFKRV